jgi:exoribonuclease R
MSQLFKIAIDNRNYSNWTIYDASSFEITRVDIECNPIQHKLFNGDVFSYENSVVTIKHSSIRNIDNIPAVLILSNNKTFGRNAKGKLLYKCVPDDIRLPAFLVPYEIKNVGFSKVFPNLYVTIHCTNWSDKQPHAVLTNSIGPVDILDNFYEYQLYCKSLHASIQKFTKDASTTLTTTTTSNTKSIVATDALNEAFIQNIASKMYPDIEHRLADWSIFSIDPTNSKDFDDAFSIKKIDDNTVLLSIYIANVSILMDALNLWPSFSERISTIYLPDKKRPMLPTVLSDCLCSLQAGCYRFAFVLDLTIDIRNLEIVSTKYSNCLIRVKKNFVYEEPDLLVYAPYLALFDVTKNLTKKYKYINNIRNSHEAVCYLMILMNFFSAKELLKARVGIFRSTVVKKGKEDLHDSIVPEEISKFVKIWNSSYGQYIDISLVDDPALYKHDLLEMDAYIHITSPIRRLVDLLNMIQFQQVFGLNALSQNADDFYLKWINQLDYINVTMRAIKKVQNDCALMDTCFNNLATLDALYDGYCFDKIVRSDGLYQYIVYLPELKLTSKITVRENMDNYALRQYKLFVFNNEERFKKKIRLHIHM